PASLHAAQMRDDQALTDATGTSFDDQQPTGRTAWVGCTAVGKKTTASSSASWFSKLWYALMNATCFSGSSLREIAFGLRHKSAVLSPASFAG
ncbi:MAG: hypothetical protein WBN97_02925, partial [Parvibaculum sp.]